MDSLRAPQSLAIEGLGYGCHLYFGALKNGSSLIRFIVRSDSHDACARLIGFSR